MSNYKVVVTDYEYSTFEPEKEVLGRVGIELTLEQCLTEEDVILATKDADAIINQYAPITRNVIENLKNCKIISRYGVGVNTIDVDAATEKGILVANVTDYCLDEVSDHAIALILACGRKVTKLNNDVKSGNWDYKVSHPIFRLRGRTLGLVGLGNIAQLVAKKAQVFGLNIIAFDPFLPETIASQLNVSLVSLDDLCQRADFISVHTPLNKSTEGMITHEQFNKMKPEAFIINTSRGPIIDETALIDALQKGKIAGAGLDVVEREPIAETNPLLTMDNVILNPHVSWYSEESEVELKRKVGQNVADALTGYLPDYLVNKEVKDQVKLKQKA